MKKVIHSYPHEKKKKLSKNLLKNPIERYGNGRLRPKSCFAGRIIPCRVDCVLYILLIVLECRIRRNLPYGIFQKRCATWKLVSSPQEGKSQGGPPQRPWFPSTFAPWKNPKSQRKR